MGKCTAFVIACLVFFVTATQAYAIEDPLATTNNKFGIHILFVYELPQAAQLVNSNGGDWGYVTIPIQAGDRDLLKWQTFMDDCKKYHVIPIIRLATEGDYFNTKVWRKPNEADILDFANFLNSLNWPTKNHYIIIFNEVNRSDEWGGFANPAEYAQLLSYAVTVFKSETTDFFLISSGLDNASANVLGMSFDSFDYLRLMNIAVPGIFNQIDGLGSHSYPNPGFAKPPSHQDRQSIATFLYEKRLAESVSQKQLPIFITETGWSQQVIPQTLAARYLQEAFTTVWNNPSVVAITPFLLNSGAGPFVQFSFTDSAGQPNEQYKVVQSIAKVKGFPKLADIIPGGNSDVLAHAVTKDFRNEVNKGPQGLTESNIIIPVPVKVMLKWLMKL